MADINQECKYRRILLKLSGEALMGGQKFGIDPAAIGPIASEHVGTIVQDDTGNSL